MPTTYDLSSAVGRTRLLIPDTDTSAATWTDEEVQAFLGLEDQNEYRAAALALETIASNTTIASGVAVRFADGTSIEDGSKATSALLARARMLRSRADAAEAREDDGAFDTAEVNSAEFAARRIWRNDYRRRRL